METGQVNERFHAEKEMVMETLFVIGAGTMGGGIAQVAALNGFTVYLYDIKQEFVDKGLKGIVGAWDKLVARGKMAAEDRDAALPRIIGTLDMQDAAKADVVTDRAVEDLDAILSQPRLDAIMVGPYDLSGSMGLTGRFDHPDFKAVMARIHEACRRHHARMGLHVVQPDPEELRRQVAAGSRFIAYGIDSVFLWQAAARPAGV